MDERHRRGIRVARLGLAVNAVLMAVKIAAGVLGNSYALIADGVESATDVFSSLIVWRGVSIAGRSADEDFHFGYGKAETISATIVALMLMLAAIGIAFEAIREIVTPHGGPAPWTLAVLTAVIVVKEALFRKVRAASDDVHSRALENDAWHHRSDAITSATAFAGIGLAVVGGPDWAPADDWAALFASAIIAFNGLRLLRPSVADLMDRAPEPAVLDRVRSLAAAVPGVLAIEKVQGRRAGLNYLVAIHVQADPSLSLRDAHDLGGRVRAAIRSDPLFLDAIVHMEPYEGPPGTSTS
jgi:cation diffusion facilitator family transporter